MRRIVCLLTWLGALALILLPMLLLGCARSPAPVPATQPLKSRVATLATGAREIADRTTRTSSAIDRAQVQQHALFRAASADLHPLVEKLGNELATAKAEASALQAVVGHQTSNIATAEAEVATLQGSIDTRERAHAAQLLAEQTAREREREDAASALTAEQKRTANEKRAREKSDTRLGVVEDKYHRLKWPACAAGGLLAAWLVFRLLAILPTRFVPALAGYRILGSAGAGAATSAVLAFKL